MSKVLITGGTGLVGRQLSKRLQEKGYEVAILSRTESQNSELPTYTWDLERKFIEDGALDGVDYIVHLAGENIGSRRWTAKRKQQLLDSRIKSAELIFETLNKQNSKINAFITASAIGYYGAISKDDVFDESSTPHHDFLGQTCYKWEQAADKYSNLGIRSVKIRTGLILSRHGGILHRISIPVRLGIGSPLGNGNQYMPWIHMDDLCNIYLYAIENKRMLGAYNAVAPDHISNKEFIKRIARRYKRPLWFPNVPASFIRLIFGEMSVMLLSGSRISSDKILSAGYKFKHPGFDGALEHLMHIHCSKSETL